MPEPLDNILVRNALLPKVKPGLPAEGWLDRFAEWMQVPRPSCLASIDTGSPGGEKCPICFSQLG